jgi:hypothetical protein
VADQLGTAVLELEIDLKPLEAGLERAKQLIQRTKPELTISTGGAEAQFRRIETSTKNLQSQLSRLQNTPLNLDTRALNKLGDDAVKAGTEIGAFTRAVINGTEPLANNIAGLQSQSIAFSTLAANVRIGTAEFRNFTQAAAEANQKELFADLEQIDALERLFRLGGFGGQSSFKGTEQLLEFSERIGKTPAAIQLYITALQQALSVTKTTDINFAKLTGEIDRQTAALATATNAAKLYSESLRQPQLALPPGRGPGQFVFQGKTAEELAAEQRSLRRQQKISERIDYFSTGGTSPIDRGLLARPNAEAIKRERELAAARGRTATQTAKARTAESKRNQDILSNALIGGAFPLLFGQGIGAAAGGAAGGGFGGAIGGQFGFGLSLVGTAVGAQFDEIINKATTLGRALDDPIRSFGDIQGAALLSSRGLERQIESLIAVGREAEAAALIQQDLANSYGGAAAAKQLADEQDRLNRNFTILSVNLGQLALPALADGAGEAADALGGLNEILRRLSSIDFPRPQGIPKGFPGIDQIVNPLGSLVGVLGAGSRALFPRDEVKNAENLAAASDSVTAAEAKRRELLTAQFGVISAQVQGYKKLALEREKELSLTREAVDLDNLRARGAKEPELTARREAGTIERFRLQEELKKQAREENVLQQTREPILQNQLKLIEAQTSGYERQALVLQRQLIDQEAAQQIALRPGESGRIEEKALVDRARITAQIAALDRDRLATTEQQNAQAKITSEALDRQFKAAQGLAQIRTPGGVTILRENAALVSNLLESVSATVDRQLEIEARIRAAQIRGGERSELEIAELGRNQVVAARESRNLIFDAATRLKEAGESLRDNLRSSIVELTRVRSDPSGLNRFLTPQQRSAREQEDFRRLLPQFREAEQRARQLVPGLLGVGISGPTADVNQAIRDFIKAVDTESAAVQQVNQTRDAIREGNEALVTVNQQLAEATKSLADKDWVVSVNVVNQAGGSSTVNAINGLA